MSDKNCAFFMGANSKKGFVSFFDNLTSEPEVKRVFTIKSGPGCGKSTMIKRFAQSEAKTPQRVEYIYCSSDPKSLDGAFLHSAGTVFLDGTSPHITEPDLPGAAGGYIALPDFIDIPTLEKKREAIAALFAASKENYAQAYRLIAASALVTQKVLTTVKGFIPQNKINRRAKGIVARELPAKGHKGVVRYRFIDGITPDGAICLSDTVLALASKIYELKDSFGLSYLLLTPIMEAAIERGYEVYACMSPIESEKILHLIIPEMSLAFITEDGSRCICRNPYRRIRLDAYVPAEELKLIRGKIRLLSRISRSMIEDAVLEIAAAHALHDKIEELYAPHIDFPALDRLAESFSGKSF